MELKINNEFKSLLPRLTSDEYDALETSILREGIRDPLIVWNGVLIDGHNRYNIAQEWGLDFEIFQVEFDDKYDALKWIYDNQKARRNWTDGNRFEALQTLRQHLKEKGKEKQGSRTDLLSINDKKLDRNHNDLFKCNVCNEQFDTPVWHCSNCDHHWPLEETKCKNCHTSKGHNTREEIAKELGWSTGKVAQAEQIWKKADDEIKEKVKNGDMTIHQGYIRTKRKERPKDPPELPDDKYRIIYADPPWKYGNVMPDYVTEQADHYNVMSISEICELPVNDITQKNAVLFLWVTSPILEESFRVIKAWGFKYKTSFVWDKIKHNMGHYNSVRHEFLLVCTRGSCTPDVKKLFDSVQSIERSEHSEKPERFREIIDTIYPNGNRIELFARKETEDWEVFGDEA